MATAHSSDIPGRRAELASGSDPGLLIVILNYRTADLTIACLRSLAAQVVSVPGVEVVVTDNASGDGSAERISAAIRDEGMSNWARCDALPLNGGYAYGNNAPIRRALARPNPPAFVLLLNPDTELRPYAVTALVEFMRAHSDCGIAGSRLEDPDGTPQCSAFNFPSAWSELDRGLQLGLVTRLLGDRVVQRAIADEACEVDWVAGASMLVRSEVFERVGLIDEAYFLYFEEVDFLLRAKRAGYRTYYVPQSRVVHHVGASTGVTNEKRPPNRIPNYWFDSRRRYFLKNHGLVHAVLADSAFLTGYALQRVRRMAQPKPTRDPPHLVTDYLRNTVLLRGSAVAPARTR